MATQISPAIAKDLANVIEMIKKNGGTIATNQKNYKTWFDGLKKANVDGTAEQIDMNQSRLRKVVDLMDKDIYGVNAALSLLSQLAKDDGLMEAKGAVVKALTDKMSDTQKQLSKELADARVRMPRPTSPARLPRRARRRRSRASTSSRRRATSSTSWCSRAPPTCRRWWPRRRTPTPSTTRTP